MKKVTKKKVMIVWKKDTLEAQYGRSDDEWTDIVDNVDDSVVPQLGQSEPVIDVEVYANEPCRMTKYRKSRSLTDALETIQRLRTEDQAKILRKAVNQSDIQDMETLLMSNAQDLNEAKLTNGLICYLKRFKLHRREEKDNFCSLLWGICGDSLMNDDFMQWLAGKLEKRKDRLVHAIQSWLSVTTECVELRGRKGLNVGMKQAIHDSWHDYSTVTVDRRDGKDQVVMLKDNFQQKIDSKRNREMVRSTRRIATKTYREMKDILRSKQNINVSLGSIAKFKPFYIQTATEREKECCLCKFCLNIRLKFKALLKHLKGDIEVTESLTENFGHGIICPKGANGFFDDKCVSSSCDDENCSPNKVKYSMDDFVIPENVEYHQFVKEVFEYKKDETKKGSRTVRKTFTENFTEFKENLDKAGAAYLRHRFEIKNDLYIWPQILSEKELGYIFHMDYSENISCMPKYEPQDAHFSGNQTSLHCTVVYKPDRLEKEYVYAYHLSDDRTHDSAFTTSVTRDLLETFPDFVEYPLLRIKSDNCSTQYCCQFLFRKYLKLAKEIDKPILLYYGVNGHGRGLVDAMSGFGVKSPLRRKIVTDEFFFNTSEELKSFLVEEFKTDYSKIYGIISANDLQRLRRMKKGVEINGCRKARMISLFHDGTFKLQKRLCNCKSCMKGLFDKCLIGNVDSDMGSYDVELEEEIEELDETDDVVVGDLFEFAETGNYVALYSATNFEMFYLFHVSKKEVAVEAKSDIYGHIVQEGECYFEGFYLEKVRETNKRVIYKKLKKLAYVHPQAMFCPNVSFNEEEMCMEKIDYVTLSQFMLS